MSDKLVMEFYDPDDRDIPVACVLTVRGGDNPADAAITVGAFVTAIANISEPRFDDAGLLAARFVAWEGQRESGKEPFEFMDVSIIPYSHHGYQVARVYARHGLRPLVEYVQDQYTKAEEMEQAVSIMKTINCFR